MNKKGPLFLTTEFLKIKFLNHLQKVMFLVYDSVENYNINGQD